MAQKCHGVDQIIPMLRRADVELGKGKKVPEVCKRLGIAQQTYYRWRQKYGGMGSGDGQRAEGPPEGEHPAEEAGGRSGPGQRHLEGSREGKLLSPERRRLTVAEVRRRFGA